MKRSVISLSICVALAGGLIIAQSTAQSPSDSPAPQAPASKSDAASAARGAQAWANHCSRCHNLRSPSELSPELWDVSVQHMRVRANLPGSVANDIKLFLMTSSASEQEAAAPITADEGSNLQFANLAAGDSAHGKEIYSQTCFACHGVDGKGAIDGVPDFTIKNGRLAKPDDALLVNMIKGFQSEGSLMAMPPMGGNPELTDQDMADVLAYMRNEFEKQPK